MQSERATLLLADSHTLFALPSPPTTGLEQLRGGICKIGSGTDFLNLRETTINGEVRTLTYAGAMLFAMGKKP
jgi:hypothetical protein